VLRVKAEKGTNVNVSITAHLTRARTGGTILLASLLRVECRATLPDY